MSGWLTKHLQRAENNDSGMLKQWHVRQPMVFPAWDKVRNIINRIKKKGDIYLPSSDGIMEYLSEVKQGNRPDKLCLHMYKYIVFK